jgi:hypothetical protein
MLVSKITPAAKKIIQVNPFEQKSIEGDLMIVNVQKYVVGSLDGTFNDDNVFEVKFGNMKQETKPDGTTKDMFDSVIVQRIKMTTQEVSTWGLDDHILHQLIIDKINENGAGLTIVSQSVQNIGYTI